MKSERRHELQHNDLAEWLSAAYERLAPYKMTILGVGVAAIVAWVGFLVWHSHSQAQAAEAWSALGLPGYQPNCVQDWKNTLGLTTNTEQNYSGTPAAQWAGVYQGDALLALGTNSILTDKKTGLQALSGAHDAYAKALETLNIPGAKERAMFGLARATESLVENKAQLDEAVAAYENLNGNFPKGIYQQIANSRIEQLKKPGALEFYQALAKYTPKPAASTSTPPAAGSSQEQLNKPGALTENPPEGPLVPTPPVAPGSGASGPSMGIPEPSTGPSLPTLPLPKASGMVLPTVEPPKGSAVKMEDVQPDAPSAPPKDATPKDTASKEPAPKDTATKAEPPKKDK